MPSVPDRFACYNTAMRYGILLLVVLLLVGCAPDAIRPIAPTLPPSTPLIAAATATDAPIPTATPTSLPTLAPTATPTLATPTATATATPIPPATATPDPYAGLAVADLAQRTYGGGLLEIADVLEETETFTRYLITYPSDGLTIFGFMNVPHDGVKFPVALVLHGYIDPAVYNTVAYTTRYADALAEAGYFVIHPNYRNYPPSDSGPDPFRIGYATDILNLIAVLQEQSQDSAGVLRRADADHIHVMGHSMGGGIALRVATVWPDALRAVLLYGSMSGDERLNYEQIQVWSDGNVGDFELAASAETLSAISPAAHLERLQAPIAVHHSRDDAVVPVVWSETLCTALDEIGHPHDCYFYDAVPHTFNGPVDQLFIDRMIAFFRAN